MVNNKLEFYQNAKIYKITDNTNATIYIGSTCKKLCQRIAQHRAHYKAYLNNNYNYVTSFEILKNCDYDIILLEQCQGIENIEQLRARERYYIDTLNCVNKNIPGQTRIEYYEKNKDKISEYQQEYRESNKDKIKEYYEKNKDKIKEYLEEYVEKNKDKIKNYQQEYRESNKDKQHEYYENKL
jgi:hypothetical protein